MYRKLFALLFAGVVWGCGCFSVLAIAPQESAQTPATDEKVDFAKTIKPFLESYCIKCHGPNKAESFRVDVREDLMAYIEAGDASASDLYSSLTTDDQDLLMPPPAETARPTKAEIRQVRDWIQQGASWPAEVTLADPADAAKPAVDDNASVGEKLWVGVGALHPAAVHLPIGLLLGAGLFALLGIRGNFVMSDCAYYCLWVGSLTSIVACAVGWSYAINKGYGGDFDELFDMEKAIFWHRISGIGVSIASFLLALYAAAARSSDPDDGFMWKLGAMLLAVGIGIVGHQGGDLTYGENHYRQLYQAIEAATGLDLGTKANQGAADPQNDSKPDANSAADIKTGQTSNEKAGDSGTTPKKSEGAAEGDPVKGTNESGNENKGSGDQAAKAENVG